LHVGHIGHAAFQWCLSLTSVTIPASVRYIADTSLWWCYHLSLYFKGNAPFFDPILWQGAANPRVYSSYYLPGNFGWWGGRPPVLWNPQVQTGDASFGVKSNQFGFNITGTNNFTVVVEACAKLASPVWVPLQTITLTNGLFYFSDPEWTNYSSRYYSLQMP
jgi:hypothetical protein